MYTIKNFRTKKDLKVAIAMGEVVRIYQPNDIFCNPKARATYSGVASVEGPHYPAPHTWGAEVTLKDGKVIKVR